VNCGKGWPFPLFVERKRVDTMHFRRASMADLPQLKTVYRKIIAKMKEDGIEIWDDIYPCEYFVEDIAAERFYLLEEGNELLAGFALCRENPAADKIQWNKRAAAPWYISRLGVDPAYLRRGLGYLALQKAVEQVRKNGGDSLRLLVGEINRPAIALYQKAGFLKAQGIYEQPFSDSDETLMEIAFDLTV